MHRRDEILARTDPFDLSQAIDRYVHALSADRVRALVMSARERLGSYYRAEFARLLTGRAAEPDAPELAGLLQQPWSEEALQSALATLLKTNLRAIPIFGPAFCDSVLAEVPGDRTVAIGEERRPPGRALAFIGIAAGLIVAGAAGEHFLTGRAAQPPPVVTYALPSPTPRPAQRLTNGARHASRIAIAPARSAPPQSAPPQSAPPEAAPPAQAVPVRTLTVHPSPSRRPATPRPAHGVATVVIPQPAATPEPSPLDVTDMPQSYTDATPLPQVSAPSAGVPGRVRLVTPTPQPRRHHWLYRSIMHLDPFKPRPRSTP